MDVNHLKQWLTPVWESDIVYGESLLMVRDASGLATAPLLFDPISILAVQSADLRQTFVEGKDWALEDGCIVLPPRSRIPCCELADMYPADFAEGSTFPRRGGGYSLWAEGHFFHDHQIAVTYSHAESGALLPIPSPADLPRTFARLRAGQLKMVLFGDSIAEGFNSSGLTGAPPFQPSWGELLAENLRRRWRADVDFSNPSLAGKDSLWGLEHVEERVNPLDPELVIIAFGMNELFPGPVFADRIAAIMNKIRAAHPEVEFILAATSLPNPEVILGGPSPTDPTMRLEARYQGECGAALESLTCPGVALADFGDLQRGLLTRKRYWDITGNNVNHPNDFFCRLHAHVVDALLTPLGKR